MDTSPEACPLPPLYQRLAEQLQLDNHIKAMNVCNNLIDKYNKLKDKQIILKEEYEALKRQECLALSQLSQQGRPFCPPFSRDIDEYFFPEDFV